MAATVMAVSDSGASSASRLVPTWTGREVRALRAARRMSVREFAAHLGVSDRMVSKWEAGGTSIRPRPVNQAALDTSLARADATARSRFDFATSARDHPMPGTSVADSIAAAAVCVLRHPDDGKLMSLVGAGIAMLGPDNVPTWVPGFFMDVYPTTNADYARFVAATGYSRPGEAVGSSDPRHPVVGVGLADASAYARWAGKALPTGEQWEKAARGSRGRVYPWGDDFSPDRCNVRGSRIKGTTPAGWYEQSASPYGIVDLCGNVWEWTTSVDEHGSWQTRGGSFATPGYLATPSSWHGQPQRARRDDLGFRCVISLEAGLELLSI
jgi:transcriptional regulator with XRE-family HTH domain